MRFKSFLATASICCAGFALAAAPAPAAVGDIVGCNGQPAAGYGITAGCFDGTTAADSAGDPFLQAGGHPYAASARIRLNTTTDPLLGPGWAIAPPKDILVDLPPGLIGNPTGIAKCSLGELWPPQTNTNQGTGCPAESQVGVLVPTVSFGGPSGGAVPYGFWGVYNMIPPPGVPARFGAAINGVIVTLDAKLRSGSDYGLSIDARNLSEGLALVGTDFTFWGVPSDPSHDAQRYCPHTLSRGCSSSAPPRPFVTLPTSCTPAGQGLLTSMHTDSWAHPGALDGEGEPVLSDPNWKSASFESHLPPDLTTEPNPANWGPPQGPTGCGEVPVKGTIAVQPTSQDAETSTGLKATVTLPIRLENDQGITTSDLKAVRVTLPVGFTINPSQGDGLGACTPAQYASEEVSFHPKPNSGCPSTAKIGTVIVHTPLLEEPLEGSIYVAQPDDPATSAPGAENPFDSLLALYVVIKNPERGVLIKLAGKVELDPRTGQLSTNFDNLPQLPFTSFELQFREGVRAPLATPSTCGEYTTQAEFTPWSEPSHKITSQSSFQITHGVGGGPCPSGGLPPFKPQVISGTENNDAGAYSPFYLRLIREDGEQELTRFSTTLPPGLTGNLTGIPFCPEADIDAARNATGTQELNSPSCPAASAIGHTIVSAGVGSVLAQTPGRIYLAGPYHGAPLSIVSVTSATVGPFDLGTVVIRFALRINPSTAQVEVDSNGSDPIPHIIDGVVVHVREIRVYMDRSRFILNPTSCAAKSISNIVTGAGADFTNPADAVAVTLANPFQAADCSSLLLKPAFKVSTPGKTSRANGAGLTAKLTIPSGPLGSQANIARVKVDLPKQLPSRLTTLQKACTAAQFDANPAGCPAASVVGHARALTPILPVPLEGPAYFVSHGGEAFPSLIVVLQGYGVTVDLVGSTFISKTGITSSTFKPVPDVPVGSFELTLPEGKFSALAANGNLCTTTLAMPTEFVGQNGAVIHQRTPIAVVGCPDSISFTSHRIKGRTLSISVSVPGAGKLTASGRGLSRASKVSKGREIVKLSLNQSKAGKLATKLKLRFTPVSGRKLSKILAVRFEQ